MAEFTTETAYEILQSQSPTQAIGYAESWLQAEPQSFTALQFSGMVYAKVKDFERALYFFKEALLQQPNERSCHLNLSNVYVALGKLELAKRHLHEILRLNPQHAESYNNLGRLFYKEKRIEEAIPYFEKALRIQPNFWEAHYNLAHSLAIKNQLDRSAVHYQEVIRLVPNHPTAHFNLGLIYVENQQYELAEKQLTKALSLDNNNLETMRQLGKVYVSLGKIQEAMQMFEKALSITSNLADVQHDLAILYLRNNNPSKALAHFKEAFALDPTNETAQHMIHALMGASTKTAPTKYVEQLFDQYADYYNEHLKHKLKYQAPALLRNAVGRCLENNPQTMRILDLGCGTGLCGIVFCDLAKELIGIDLSYNMIEKAKALNVYDKLLIADIQDYLSTPALEPFQLILACDVLVYRGDLNGLFEKISHALVTGGRFAFTTEHLQEGNYALQPTGRFAHSIDYIHAFSKANHLLIEYEEPITLREHEGNPVAGRLTILKKPS